MFEFQAVQVGIIRLRNIESGKYLAMDKHGNLCGRVSDFFSSDMQKCVVCVW